MKLEVWTLPGCGRCERVKERLRVANVEFVERDLPAVRRAEVRDPDLLTQSILQNDEAPVIRVLSDNAPAGRGAAFIDPDFLDDWLARHPAGG